MWILTVMILLAVTVALYIWTKHSEKQAHVMPGAEMISIEEPVRKPEWAAADLQLLQEQTGLSSEALFYLAEKDRKEDILLFQKAYFQPVIISCRANTIITREECVVDEMGISKVGMPIPYLEEGDILITGCSHFLGWRNGHAALVVNAEKRLILEAQVLGQPAVITTMNHWERYPSFMVLRLKGADKEERKAIAAYAEKYLEGVSYRLAAGIMDRIANKSMKEIPQGTHCAHLVWYAYKMYGYDLDSDGGIIVTPKDIAKSEKLKIIQSYGVK